MKRFISSTSTLFRVPKGIFKKIKFSGFVAGLIFGALFSLLVNIVTVQIQERVQRQHILEALENEILSNVLQSNNVISNFEKNYNGNELPNFFYVPRTYTRDLWEQSSEGLQYLAQLSPDVQTSVNIFYTVTLPAHNSLIERLRLLADQRLANCYFRESSLSDEEKQNCIAENKLIMELEFKTAGEVGTNGLEVLSKFHPTQDRLNNRFLRLLMGDKSIRVLSGE